MSFRISSQTTGRVGWAAVFVLVFLSAFSLSGTRPPRLELDPSWHVVLEYASSHHWQFGTQIISTYGPLGFLAAPFSLGHLVGARLAFAFFWSALVALTATGLARRLTGWVRCAFLAWLVLFALCEGLDQVAFWVLACGALILLLDDPAQRRLQPVYLFAFLVLSLIKVSFLTAGCVSLIVVVVSWLCQRKFLKSTVLALAAPAGFVVCWIALAQRPLHLAAWVRYFWELESGYSGAMGLAPKASVLGAALAALGLFAGALLVKIARAPRTLVNWSAAMVLAEYVFWAWKEGMTRSGNWHTFVFLWFLPLGLVFFFVQDLSLASSSHGRVLEIMFAAGMVLCLAAAHFQLPGFAWRQFAEFPRRIARNTETIATVLRGDTAGLYADCSTTRNLHMLLLDHAQDVIGDESVDVMNYLALAAVVNGMNYRPRPVFQGVQAYTSALQIRNQEFFQSGDRPRFVMLCQQTTDDRFPTLEDSAALNYVLNNYVPVAQDGPFLVLQQRTKEVPGLQVVHEQTVKFGQSLDVSPWADAPLFMSVAIVPRPWGRAITFLYQQPALCMQVERAGVEERYRIVPSMAAEPFLLNPVLNRNSDVLSLYLSVRRPQASTVVFERPPYGSWEFQDDLRVRLYTAPGFLRAAEGVSPDNMRADVQGRVFASPPESVQNSVATRVVIFHGSAAWRVGAPSKIVLKVPPNALAFLGNFGIPAALGDEKMRDSVRIGVNTCGKPGACRGVFQQLVSRFSGAGADERFSFQVPIDRTHDRYIELTTEGAPSAGGQPSLSVWSRCRFDFSNR